MGGTPEGAAERTATGFAEWGARGVLSLVGLAFVGLPFWEGFQAAIQDRYDGQGTSVEAVANPVSQIVFGILILVAVMVTAALPAPRRAVRCSLLCFWMLALCGVAVDWLVIARPVLRFRDRKALIDSGIASAPRDHPFSGCWGAKGGRLPDLYISPGGSAAIGTRLASATFDGDILHLDGYWGRTTYWAASWGTVRYLVPTTNPLALCEMIRLRHPDTGMYSRKFQGIFRRGSPKGPAEVVRCLQPNRVEATIIGLKRDWREEQGGYGARFEISAGYAELVYRGREFDILLPDGSESGVKPAVAGSVSEHRSQIDVTVGPGERRPGVGWRALSQVDGAPLSTPWSEHPGPHPSPFDETDPTLPASPDPP